MKSTIKWVVLSCATALSSAGQAATLTFEAADFATAPVFSNVQTFSFTIELGGSLSAGESYINPALNSVVYNVSGGLGSTPSGFPGFNLQRSIPGAEFYSQGSSLAFTISAGADLTDGLQVSELESNGLDPVFTFDGREVGTGRYHPALVELYSDGTGKIQNSNNFGGINPASMQFVDVDYGDEYITDLTFDPTSLTLSEVPAPAAIWLFGTALLGLSSIKSRKGSGKLELDTTKS